jgi:hypothetical protein
LDLTVLDCYTVFEEEVVRAGMEAVWVGGWVWKEGGSR